MIAHAVQVDDDVGPSRGRATPVVEEVDARRMAPALELTLESAREVIVTPARHFLPVRDPDQDAETLGVDPRREVVADLGRTVAIGVALEHDIAERRLERAGLVRVCRHPVEYLAELRGRVGDGEASPMSSRTLSLSETTSEPAARASKTLELTAP